MKGLFWTSLSIILMAGALAGFVFSYARLQVRQPPPVANGLAPTSKNTKLTTPVPVSRTVSPTSTAPHSIIAQNAPSTGISANQATTSTTSGLLWQSYSNKRYRFSIRYPCESDCQTSPPGLELAGTDDFINGVQLPTLSSRANDSWYSEEAVVMLYGFTSQSIIERNDNTGADAPDPFFPWSLGSLRTVLQQPADSLCALKFYDRTTTLWYEEYAGSETFPCRVVSLAGQKAVEVTNEPIPLSDYDGSRTYYFSRGRDLWLKISEYYSFSDHYPKRNALLETQREHDQAFLASYLSGKSVALPAWMKRDIDATREVLATLMFY